ncbi:aldehyde dehydrogenase [Sphingobium phenoxybenzoativorans]|uniref:aldehyde dehydrogenase n=1 Tax=Sphingobium phenoxybenzoativorans TaxID=1592790 RepID=UPI0008726DD8|nr:aldehyde dehydrogenase [Sphingobium phenoxybenzoativorans]
MPIQDDFRGVIAHPDQLFIGGRWVAPTSDEVIDVVSPATEENFFRLAAAGPADIDAAITAARTAFDQGPWPRLSLGERAGFLRALSKELTARAEILSGVWAGEMGALFSINTQLMPMLTGIYADHADMGDSFPFVEPHAPAGGGSGLLVREPVGVVAAIVPWNGPLMLANWKCAPALLAGCTVILKASPEAAGTLYLLAEAAEAIGLPEGVLNVLVADRENSELLVRDVRVDKVSFTGSTAAGRRIGGICGDRIARCTLELGGKSPAILLDDYDPDTFAVTVAEAALIMAGQACSALTRIIVPRTKHARVAEAIKARFDTVRIGDPFDPATELGPLAMARQREKVEYYIAEGQSEGAQLVAGGKRPSDLERGYYIEPTLFTNVESHMRIAQEEIFGPVLSMMIADDEEHAMEIANRSDYGLNASVFTNDRDRAIAAARRLRSGTVAHNAFRNDFTIAFGGFKQSGIGREGGIEGLRHYTETKTILLES